MNRNIFNFFFASILVLQLVNLAYAKLTGPPKFIMSTGKTVSSLDQASELVKANQTAILNKLGSDIKTLMINYAVDSENIKMNSQIEFDEVVFLFDQTTRNLPLNRTQFGKEVAAIPGKGRLCLVNVPIIRKGAPYPIANGKVIVGIEHNVRITPTIQTKEGLKDGEPYFEDLDIPASEFRILITEEGDLYSWY